MLEDLPKGRGVLDHPLEPVIGLAEGETRWRVTTTVKLAPLLLRHLDRKRAFADTHRRILDEFRHRVSPSARPMTDSNR
jgi:hypothetical protein